MELSKLKNWFRRVRHKVEQEYKVSFKVFAFLYILSFVPFYAGLFLATQGAIKKSAYLVILGLIINRLAWALPYLYPYFFGQLPKKIRLGILLWMASGIAYGVLSFNWK